MKFSSTFALQRGVAAVELALVIIFLLLLTAGIVEFGRAFWYYDALTKATRDGARMLSVADKATFSSGTFIGEAKFLVTEAANAANLKPPLSTAQVSVTCMNKDFNAIGCADGSDDIENVRVAITGYSIDIGGMFPFLSPTGGASKVYSGVALAPQTTMPYMK